jgi:hypothetical protein
MFYFKLVLFPTLFMVMPAQSSNANSHKPAYSKNESDSSRLWHDTDIQAPAIQDARSAAEGHIRQIKRPRPIRRQTPKRPVQGVR